MRMIRYIIVVMGTLDYIPLKQIGRDTASEAGIMLELEVISIPMIKSDPEDKKEWGLTPLNLLS